MVIGLPNTVPPNGVCKGYMLGKHHHAPFDSGKAWRAKKRMEFVHNDFCYMNKRSLAVAKYIKHLLMIYLDLCVFIY